MLSCAPVSESIVFIFWPDLPTSYSNASHVTDMEVWKLFRNTLFGASVKENFPKEIVFVNMESTIAGNWIPVEGETTPSEAAANITKADFVHLINTHLTFPHQANGNCCDNVLAARHTSFKFVSLKDYLSNWDWEGELTKEEVGAFCGSQALKAEEE
jgi:hypothetical protein